MDTLGKRIACLRKRDSITQTDLMKILKFNNLSKFENDLREPSLFILKSLSKFFNVSTDYLLCLDLEKDYDYKYCEEQEFYLKEGIEEEEVKLLELYRKLSLKDKLKIKGMIELKLSESKSHENNID